MYQSKSTETSDDLGGPLMLTTAIAVCGVLAGAKAAGPVGAGVAILICGWIALLILFARSNADQARVTEAALASVVAPDARGAGTVTPTPDEGAPRSLAEALGSPLAVDELDDLATPA
jgi:hypothetical protein